MNLIAQSRSTPTRVSHSRAAVFQASTLAGAALVIASLGTAPAAAQDERIAGIWQKDIARSDAPWPGRQDRPQPNAADIEIEIGLEGDDVVLVQTARRRDWPTPRVVTANYIADNKPTPAPDLRSGMPREVRVKWRKKKLTVSYTVKIAEFEADIQEIWEVSKDGTELVQTIFGRGTGGRPDIRRSTFVRGSVVQ